MLFTLMTCSVALLFVGTNELYAQAQSPKSDTEEKLQSEVREVLQALQDSFNTGKSAEIVGFFIDGGELIDDQGNIYQGGDEIKELLDQFFQKFAGATVDISSESIRSVGPVVIQEGTRTTILGETASIVEFTAIMVKTAKGWKIVSLRDFTEQSLPTPGEQLQVLAWMEGDWVNEGADARVKITYRWSEDKNFLLGEFQVIKDSVVVGKTSQRIAWDPILGKPRSWLFDSDGGFSEALWTPLEDGQWILRTSAVMPDGTTGSATLTITPKEKDRILYAGTGRLIGQVLEEDFELTVVRQPPVAPGK